MHVLDRHEVEDVVSEASVRLWRAGSRYDPQRGSFAIWLLAIARNCARRVVERKRRQVACAFFVDLDGDSEFAGLPDGEASEPVQAQCEFLRDVMTCIDELPTQQREVLRADLRFGGSAPADELAAELRTSANAIYAARSSARKALRLAMAKRGHFLAGDGPAMGACS